MKEEKTETTRKPLTEFDKKLIKLNELKARRKHELKKAKLNLDSVDYEIDDLFFKEKHGSIKETA